MNEYQKIIVRIEIIKKKKNHFIVIWSQNSLFQFAQEKTRKEPVTFVPKNTTKTQAIFFFFWREQEKTSKNK